MRVPENMRAYPHSLTQRWLVLHVQPWQTTTGMHLVHPCLECSSGPVRVCLLPAHLAAASPEGRSHLPACLPPAQVGPMPPAAAVP